MYGSFNRLNDFIPVPAQRGASFFGADLLGVENELEPSETTPLLGWNSNSNRKKVASNIAAVLNNYEDVFNATKNAIKKAPRETMQAHYGEAIQKATELRDAYDEAISLFRNKAAFAEGTLKKEFTDLYSDLVEKRAMVGAQIGYLNNLEKLNKKFCTSAPRLKK